MTEQKWEELIQRYASDDYTVVHTLELTENLKQVIEVSLEYDGDIYHHEGKTFEEIFKCCYIAPLIENIEYYDYLWTDFPELADEMLKEDLSFVKDEIVEYIRYVSEWLKCHDEGEPVCYAEWEMNEHQEVN